MRTLALGLLLMVCAGCNCDGSGGNDGGGGGNGGGGAATGGGGSATGGGGSATGGGGSATGGGGSATGGGGSATGGGGSATGGGGSATGGGGAATGGGSAQCTPNDAGVIVDLAGLQVDTIYSGAPLVDPVGLTFGPGGLLYVADSTSWLSPFTTSGEILRFEADGGITVFCNDTRLYGPGWVAFGPSTDGGFPPAYMGTEDVTSSAGKATDELLIQIGGAVADGPSTAEAGKLLYVTQAGFPQGLWINARENPNVSMPDPLRLLVWDTVGTTLQTLPIQSGGTLIGGVSGFAFANGGALGNDLYVSTIDDPGYTPDASVALYRVDAGFDAVPINQGLAIFDLAGSPSPAGPWGDFLYFSATDPDAGAVISRIDAAGTVTQLAHGLGSYGSVAFSPDGGLYFTDIAGHAIYRVRACGP
ncbi:MAG: hypothetical protein QM723_10725 [Myxococcaceae bacterium]